MPFRNHLAKFVLFAAPLALVAGPLQAGGDLADATSPEMEIKMIAQADKDESAPGADKKKESGAKASASASASASSSASTSATTGNESGRCEARSTASAKATADGTTQSEHDEDHSVTEDDGCKAEAGASATAKTGNSK